MRDSTQELINLCCEYLIPEAQKACEVVLQDARFDEAPGGSSHHHNYAGGLSQHTLEVAMLARDFAKGFGQANLALIAAVFHDYGKIHEYTIEADGKITRNPFQNEIGHVIWSRDKFIAIAHAVELDAYRIEAISHALLAHHGRREWGSPVEPATPLAWALHSADMLSSRGFKR